MKIKHQSEGGKVRKVRRFCWVPRRIGLETRWLEWAWIRQRYIVGNYGSAWMDDSWEER